MLSKHCIWTCKRHVSLLSCSVRAHRCVKSTVNPDSNGEESIQYESACPKTKRFMEGESETSKSCTGGLIHENCRLKRNGHLCTAERPDKETEMSPVPHLSNEIIRRVVLDKDSVFARAETVKMIIPGVNMPQFSRLVLLELPYTRQLHVSRIINSNDNATAEQQSNTDTAVLDDTNYESFRKKEITSYTSSSDKRDNETDLVVSSAEKDLKFEKRLNGKEVKIKTGTKNKNNAEVSEMRKAVVPANLEIQSMSVLEQTLREKENLELKILEDEVKNPIFPEIPLTQPSTELSPGETELTEYHPDRKRKVNFSTKIHNLAPLVNQSRVLTELVKLGVDLSKIEKTRMADKIIKLNFKKDIKPYLLFLHDVGVPHDDFGAVLTKTPSLLETDIQSLKVRIGYLKSKKFSKEEIAGMVTWNSRFLLLPTDRVDAKLGFYQRCFRLKGKEVRQLVVQSPRHILVHADWIKDTKFRLREYFGFTELELKKMLLSYPNLYIIYPFSRVEEIFNILHNKMDIPHSVMVTWPKIFGSDCIALEQRHRFLLKVDRAQYDPRMENYVSLQSLVQTKDEEFCVDVAQATLTEFYDFLKTI